MKSWVVGFDGRVMEMLMMTRMPVAVIARILREM